MARLQLPQTLAPEFPLLYETMACLIDHTAERFVVCHVLLDHEAASGKGMRKTITR